MEFMQAMHDYKQQSGRMFPTWSEVLEVLKSLGYAKPQALTAATMDETAGPLYKSSPRTKKAAQPA
jgi:hypothetical protein